MYQRDRTGKAAFAADEFKKEKHYWLEKLSGELKKTSFPYDRRVEPGKCEYREESVHFRFSGETFSKLMELSKGLDHRLYIILTAGLAAMLHRYTGSGDIVVGSPVQKQEIEGDFINTVLVLRNRVESDMTFKKLLVDFVRQTVVEANENQNYPMEMLLNRLGIPYAEEKNAFPLFDVVILLENIHHKKYIRHTHPNITFSFLKTDREVRGKVEYNSQLYERDTIERIARHYQSLTDQAIFNLDIKLSGIDILSDSEKKQLLVDFNGTRSDYPADKTIPGLFAEQVKKKPDHVALVGPKLQNANQKHISVTYGELNKASDRLAHLLREKGVRTDTIVAIMLERSLEMITGILAILKAGGAYLPIDPGYPEERVNYIMKDSRASILVEIVNCQLSIINCQWGALNSSVSSNDVTSAVKKSSAYIIYTSGSTGKPKGVLVNHGSVARLVKNTNYIDSKPGDRLLATGALEFDISTFEIWWPLLNGLSLYLTSKDVILDAGSLGQTLDMHDISVLHLIPQLLNKLADQSPSIFENLAYLLVGGDLVRPQYINSLREMYPHIKILHMYGPTENTTFSCFFPVDKTYEAVIPIGKPIANSTVYILGKNGELLPIGVAGEICTGGDGLARGYLNNPELTAEKFRITGNKHMSHIYKTGDLAKWLPGGNIEFLGRIDHQVKVRGFRIELGEIEKVLLRHPEIEDCAVVTRGIDENRQLAAYYKKRNKIELWPSLAEYFVYDDLLYLSMTRDEGRNEKYRKAMSKVIKGKTVLEIGPGNEAILSRMCIEEGARKVYAVEKLEEAFQKAEKKIKELGLEDKIILIHGDIREISLPEEVDYCVSEIVGSIGGSEGAAKIMNSARRFLKDPSRMIPYRSLTGIAAVTLPGNQFQGTFEEVGSYYVEKIFQHVGYKFDLRLCLFSFQREYVISSEDIFEDLDFTRENLLEDQHEIYLEIEKNSLLNGFIVWLNLYLDKEEQIDTLESKTIWLPVYLPVFPAGERVEKGNYIRAAVTRKLSENGINPDFTITGELHKGNGESIEFIYHCPHISKEFKGSPFYSRIFSGDELKKTVTLTPDDLGDYLSVHLPDYMVPAYLIPLEEMPLTPNGKVDRKQLPEPEFNLGGAVYAAPRSLVEETFVDIWSEALGIEKEKIGIDADFFKLGGHSLMATKVASKLHKAFNIKIQLSELFQTPTIRALAEKIEKRTAAAREDRFSSIEIMEKKEYYPLSSAQRRLYVLQQMETNSTGYNISYVVTLEGELKRESMAESFRQLIKRHETLRTSFDVKEEEPVQRIHDQVECNIEFFNLENNAPGAADRIVEDFIRPFELSRVPFRVGLITLAPGKHVLMIDMHHIITDGTSMNLAVNEFMVLYTGGELPPLKLQYKDYAGWQAGEKQKQAVQKQEQYWLEAFEGELPILNLPTDYPRPPVFSFEGSTIGFELSGEQTRGLKDLALNTGTTLYMVLLAIYNVFLSKISGQQDIVVGSPIAARRHEDLQQIIGMFVNTLAIRNYPRCEHTFKNVLKEVKKVSLAAFENQEYQFEDLVDKLDVVRNTARNPLFDAMFALQNVERSDLTIRGLTLYPYDRESHISKFDLILIGMEGGDRLFFCFEYCTTLFKPQTIEGFVRYFKKIVSAVKENPGVRLYEIDILSMAEKKRILYDFNDTGAVYSADKTLHQLFEEQAQKTPHSTAVIEGGVIALTYGELNDRAEKLAGLLRYKKPDFRANPFVAILMDRSVEMIVSVMGILKAGGAYVPLETYLPETRVSGMLASLNVTCVLTDALQVQRFGNALKGLPDLKSIISLPEALEPNKNDVIAQTFSPGHTTADDIAYVIFTSGSTGTPKGVVVKHRPVINIIQWVNNTFVVDHRDKLLFVASLGFDLSVYDIFGILASGGALRVVPANDIKNPERLLKIIFKEGITFWDSAPAALQQLVPFFDGIDKSRNTSNLRLVFLSGDWIPVTLPDTLKETFARVKVISLGGATEATIWSNYYPVQRVDASWPSIPYGKPTQNAVYYILDRHLNPRPIGTPGDLYIGGKCLAQGYVNDIELSAGKFIDNPFMPGKMYKTGDLARWFHDGNMEFLGRTDTQVKIRGFRIELGEIQGQLSKHDGVKTSVIEALGDDKKLVAYVVPDSRQAYPVLQLLKLDEKGISAHRPRYHLPNGMTLFYLNRGETDFMYKEIFEEQCYLKHGITLEDGAVVFDVGANIGLFSLFVNRVCTGARIYTFEPIPSICELLQFNTSIHGVKAVIFEHGLGAEPGEATFTYYPHISILSGRFADIEEEKEAVKTYILNRQFPGEDRQNSDTLTEDRLNELLGQRLSSTTVTRPVKTISQILRENKIEKIDLLKINVEKSEADVLSGIDDEHWPLIRQLVVEVHDTGGRLEEIARLLKNHRFEVTVEQEEVHGNTKFYQIYAVSGVKESGEKHRGSEKVPGYKYVNSDRLIASMKDLLKERLPEYMVPQAFVLLDRIPLTPNGKVDRKALPEPVTEGANYTAPLDNIQTRLAAIWAEVLGTDRTIGIDDNFFELGGHSLKATILVSKIHKAFNVKIPLVEMFRLPHIRGLSGYIKAAVKDKYASIEKVEKKEYYPLSSGQKRLYLLYRMDTESIGYNMAAVVELEGPIEKEKPEETFNKMIRRHESLRTSFHMLNEVPVQKIHDDLQLEIEYFDLTALTSEETRKNEITRHSARFIRPFNLSQAPLVRVGLIKIGEGNHILMMDMHHVISDGTSTAVFAKEFMALYNGGELPPFRLQYKDFSAWQNSRKESNALKKQEDYWLREFTGEIPVLDLPADFPRPVIQSLAGNSLGFEMGSEETKQLKTMVLEEEATLFMVLLSIFNVLLYRESGREDLVVGAATAGRLSSELEHLIGMFINALAIRNYPRGEKPFREFLHEVRDKALSAFENQEYQFEELVEKLPVNRDTGRSPLFDVVLDVQNIEIQAVEIKGLKMKPYPYQTGISKYDLVFHFTEAGDKLWITVDYSTGLFKRETIETFVRHFKKIITHIIRDRDIPIGEIDMLSEREMKQILEDLNHTPSIYPLDKPLHRLFEEQVEKYPDKIALVGSKLQITNHKHISITYKELNRASNRLARLLRLKGIGPDSIVGIMMDSSLEVIAAVLAVLKADGTYLPIDIAYPAERIEFMLDDANAAVLLTNTNDIKDHSFTSLQGVGFKLNEDRQSHVIATPPRPQVTDLEALHPVDRTAVDYEKYHRYIGLAMVKHTFSIQGTRGCPYHCAYCHKIWPKKHIIRSAEDIFNEVRQAYSLGIRRFAFIDDIFNLNEKNSRRFFQLIIDNGLEVQLFFPNGVRGDILTRDYIDLMVRAGTVSLGMALETASPRLQKMIGKNLDIEKLRENLEYFCEKYPQVILEIFAMHGFPSETEEEALKTLEFIRNLKWLHFPYFHILKIYPNTDMARLAQEKGISEKTIARSANLAFHELPETLPFDKRFTHQCQADFFNRYFLAKERLLHVLPYQMKLLTEDEMVQKYNSYLPVEIKTLRDLLEFAGISDGELDLSDLSNDDPMQIPGLDRRIREAFPSQAPSKDALRILLLDLSQYFSGDTRNMLYDVVEPPLGLMYLLTALKKEFGEKIDGKIVKSRIDFDNYDELKQLLEDFQPHLIGLRTLTYYKDFFHHTASLLRQWGIRVPVIAGGPYATSDYATLLKDRNIDLVVRGEGERTLCHIVSGMLENSGKFPNEKELREIPGIAYIPGKDAPVSTGVFGREIIMVDAVNKERAGEGAENLPLPSPPTDVNNTAYIIYTSGTTGKPKGVMVEHRNIAGLMKTGENLFHYGSHDGWTMFHSYCFDFSVWEMYGALLYGGKLVLIPRMIARDPRHYLEILKKENVTILNQTPTVFYQLVHEEMLCPSNDLRLRYVIFGGEALKPGKLKPWKEKYPETRLINMYGITETTVHVTFKEITSKEIDADISNIGKPLSSLSGYIMNKHLRLQPVRVPGELCVSGQGVSRGYLNRPELTAERFIIHHSSLINDPLYRSGDLVKLLEDGEMEYLGRIDHQVKIRGNRVETGEIERQMMMLKDMEEVVIVAREDEEGDNYLCAYMRMSPGQKKEVTTTELREALLKKMPEYMIPSYFIPLEEFPVTSTGKVDRRKLPLPEGLRPLLGASYVAPDTEIARTIAAIWQEILKVDNVGIHDNFFDLGGSSLDIVRLNGRLKEVLKKDIPIVSLFEYPTIDTFSRQLDLEETVEVAVQEEKGAEIAGRLKKGKDKMKGRRKRIG